MTHHAHQLFQPLVVQIVAELLQRLEGAQIQKRLCARDFIKCELFGTATAIYGMQESSWYCTRLY